MAKKIIISSLTIIFLFVASLLLVNAKSIKVSTKTIDQSQTIDPTTNFFGQKEDQRKVEEVEDPDTEIPETYEKVADNGKLILYVDKTTMGIAVYDYTAQYMWYSCYKNYLDNHYETSVNNQITSGVSVTCYNSSSSVLGEITMYSASKDDCTMSYDTSNDGFLCHLKFITLNVSFDVDVRINESKLVARVLFDTLVEEPYKKKGAKTAIEYKLKSVDLFPYFGSDNYEINGYTFLPDGSGALARFTDTQYDTAYIKTVYGSDEGVSSTIQNASLKNQNDLTLPIYGINHGYNQAAFLVTINEGYGSSELHSYPYMYSNINLNRTFFKFIARHKMNIEMSSADGGMITIIDSDVVSDTFELQYDFLSGTDANYVGMAKKYSESLNLKDLTKASNISLKLDVIGEDYKKGLFGKNFVKMTSYQDLKDILLNLNNNNINNINVNFIGYNQNGYFDNTLTKPKTSNLLGGKKDYNDLVSYAKENNISIYYYSNPVVATKNTLFKETIKTLNLNLFNYEFKSSLDQSGRYINPLKISDYFLKYSKNYNKLSMTNFSFDTLGDMSYSYRYKTEDFTKEEMINQVISEVEKIKASNENYQLALKTPNSYLYEYLTCYYDAKCESSKYAFLTDSIPFISLILSGHAELYSTNINYVSNYQLFNLRLVEYNIYPSFVITNESTNNLRFCNYEYLYTTQFSAWETQINETYQFVNSALKNVVGMKMTGHSYIDNGISCTTYSNGVKIYVNYTASAYPLGDTVIDAMSYYVGGEK